MAGKKSNRAKRAGPVVPASAPSGASAEPHVLTDLGDVLQELSDAICVLDVVQTALQSLGNIDLTPRSAASFAVTTRQVLTLMNGLHQRLDRALLRLPEEPYIPDESHSPVEAAG
jgi:hypothetical protein